MTQQTWCAERYGKNAYFVKINMNGYIALQSTSATEVVRRRIRAAPSRGAGGFVRCSQSVKGSRQWRPIGRVIIEGSDTL